ncbi:MAG: DUF192 domain-containing protein [Acetobacteraceae bacterium]
MNRRMLLAAAALLPAAVALPLWAQGVDETKAQPVLPKEKLVIVTSDGKSHEFNVEMATTPDQQTVGLMFRPTVPADGGMLFDWGGVRDSTMWMKNTIAPLDMLFMNSDGTIHHIAENATPESLAQIPSGGEVRGTLEVAAGTAARLHIRVGDKVKQRIFGNAILTGAGTGARSDPYYALRLRRTGRVVWGAATGEGRLYDGGLQATSSGQGPWDQLERC